MNFLKIFTVVLLLAGPCFGADVDIDADNVRVEFVGANTDTYYLNGANDLLINSEVSGATAVIVGAGSSVIRTEEAPGTQPVTAFTCDFAVDDGTALSDYIPPWHGIRFPATASNWTVTSGAVSCAPVLGSELVTNGDFSSTTGWTVVGAEITGGGLVFDNEAAYTGANRAGAGATGKWYLGGITISAYTSGSYDAKIGIASDNFFTGATSVGIRKKIIKVAGASVLFNTFTTVASSTATLDDATSKELIWSTFLSNLTDYKFKTEIVYSIDMTVADGDIAGIAFKAADLTAGSEDFCRVELNKGTGRVELKKVVAGVETTPLSVAVTYVDGAKLRVMSADGVEWVVVYNGSQVGGEQTLSESSLDSSVAGFYATSAGTTFDNWSAGPMQFGSELVTNGTGESLTGWTITEGNLSSVVADGAIGNCFKVSDTDAGTSSINSIVTFEAGKQYLVSIRVKRGSADLFWTAYTLSLTGISNLYLNSSRAGPSTSTDIAPVNWTKYEKILGLPVGLADVSGRILIGDSGGNGATEYTYFDEISIREIQ